MPDLSRYSWALWLATPVVATVTASVATWWRARPRRSSPARAAQAHQRYLDALGRAAAGRAPAPVPAGRPEPVDPAA